MKITVACVTSLLLVLSQGVAAGGYGYGHGYGHHGYGHGYGHHGYGHGYSHYSFGGHGSHAGYLVGGLLLGSLLAPPRYTAPPPVVVYAPASASTSIPVQQAQAPIGRRLLRDINGNCFERKTDAGGSELQVQLPASECAW